MTENTPTTERLTEHVADWRDGGFHVDADNRLVRNVALTGLESRNGYRYREAALREALSMYADKPVFLDHAPRSNRPHERSTRDLVGSIVEPRFESGRVRADVRVLDTEAGRTFLALVRANGPAVGMSHVVLAERSGDGQHVERVRDVVCVDAVVFPATTTTFRESEQETREETAEETLRRERDSAIRERDELAERLELLETERLLLENRQRVDELLGESGLPAFATTDAFRRRLLECGPEQRRELIAERRALIDASLRRGPISPERSVTSAGDVDAHLVRAIRRAG